MDPGFARAVAPHLGVGAGMALYEQEERPPPTASGSPSGPLTVHPAWRGPWSPFEAGVISDRRGRAGKGGVNALDPRRVEEDRRASVRWARDLLRAGGFCVLDSETTGLKPPVGFVEVAIVDADGGTLFDSCVRPRCPIDPGATRVHSHTARSLASSPPFGEAYPDLLEAMWGRRVVGYNAPYDRRVWDAEVGGLGARAALAGPLPPWECAMRRYAAHVGEPGKRGGYRNQKLPAGDHSALGDALAALRLIERMAEG